MTFCPYSDLPFTNRTRSITELPASHKYCGLTQKTSRVNKNRPLGNVSAVFINFHLSQGWVSTIAWTASSLLAFKNEQNIKEFSFLLDTWELLTNFSFNFVRYFLLLFCGWIFTRFSLRYPRQYCLPNLQKRESLGSEYKKVPRLQSCFLLSKCKKDQYLVWLCCNTDSIQEWINFKAFFTTLWLQRDTSSTAPLFDGKTLLSGLAQLDFW